MKRSYFYFKYRNLCNAQYLHGLVLYQVFVRFYKFMDIHVEFMVNPVGIVVYIIKISDTLSSKKKEHDVSIN